MIPTPRTEPSGGRLRRLIGTSTRRFWLTSALLIEAALVVAFRVGLQDQHGIDLAVYRHGGAYVRAGKALYANGFGDVFEPHLLFTYPPFSALLAAPFTGAPKAAADVVWALVNVAALAMLSRLVARRLTGRPGWRLPFADGWRLILAGALVTVPVLEHLSFGQVNLVLAAACCADVVVSKPRWPRGLLIGIATAIKVVPGMFIVLLLVARRWRDAAVAAAAFAACTLLAGVVVPSDSREYWTHALFDSGRPGDNANFSNQALRGLLLRAFGDNAATTALWLGMSAVVVGYGLRQASRALRGGQSLLAVGITAAATVLVSPISWVHHLIWLVVWIPLVGWGAGASGRRGWAAAGLWLLFVLNLPRWGESIHAGTGSPVVSFLSAVMMAAYGLAVAAMFVLMCRDVRAPTSRSDVSGDRASCPQAVGASLH